MYIGPLSSASISLDNGSWPSPANFTAKATGLTVGLDVLFDIIDQVSVKADRSGLVNAVTHALTSDCVKLMTGTTFDLSGASLGQATSELTKTLQQSVACLQPVITTSLLSQIGGISREQAGAIFSKLDRVNALGKVIDYGQLANRYLELLRDQIGDFHGGFTLSKAAPPPAVVDWLYTLPFTQDGGGPSGQAEDVRLAGRDRSNSTSQWIGCDGGPAYLAPSRRLNEGSGLCRSPGCGPTSTRRCPRR